MKDIAKTLEHEGVNIPKIKGHTRIELTSVKDGSKRFIEHDNTFQSDIIAKRLRSLGAYNSSIWRNPSATNLWKTLLGGIFFVSQCN